MEIKATDQSISKVIADAIIVGAYRGQLTSGADEIDRANGGVISRLMELEEFKPDIGKVLPLYFPDGCMAPIVLVVGLGAREEWDSGAAYRALGTATRALTDRKRRTLAVVADAAWDASCVEAAVAGAAAGCYGPGLYQAEPKRIVPEQILRV